MRLPTTFPLLGNPNGKLFTPWVLQEMNPPIYTTQFGASGRG